MSYAIFIFEMHEAFGGWNDLYKLCPDIKNVNEHVSYAPMKGWELNCKATSDLAYCADLSRVGTWNKIRSGFRVQIVDLNKGEDISQS